MKKAKSTHRSTGKVNRPAHAATLVSKSDFARAAGRSRAAVTQACAAGGPLAEALQGDRIDASHPAAVAYVETGSGARRGELLELLIAKRREEIRKLELANQETEGRLISRELVKTHVFGYLDGLQRKVLLDAPKVIARRLVSLARSGGSVEECERETRAMLERHLSNAKTKVSRTLREP